MQIAPVIAFHNIEKENWAEEKIQDHIARLERIYDRLIACRVHVEKRADNPTHSIPPVVRIELSLPGRSDIVVAHEPDRLQSRFQSPDLNNAINEAFRIAERLLSEHKDRQQDRCEARPEAEHELHGQVAELNRGEDFAFLMTQAGGLLYFHRNSVLNGDFDAFKRGDKVSYVENVGDSGLVATKIRLKA